MNFSDDNEDEYHMSADGIEQTRLMRDEALRLRDQFEVFIFRLDTILNHEGDPHGHH